jgi:hypothetical protein
MLPSRSRASLDSQIVKGLCLFCKNRLALEISSLIQGVCMCTLLRITGMMVAAMALVGCGGNSSTTFDKWQGSTRHLRVTGTIHGEMIDINVSGADALDTTKLWCEREYQVPNDMSGMPDYALGHNSEVRVKAPVMIGGESRLLDFGLKRHDFETTAAGTVVPVIPRDDTHSPCTLTSCTNANMWLSWTWRNPADNSVIYKAAAQSGSFTLGEFVGTPDSSGLIIPENTGNVGGFASGQWSATDSIVASFDANCTKNFTDNSY